MKARSWNVREKNPKAKLTHNKVCEIRALRKQGVLITELARRYGVGHSHISQVVKGRYWGTS